MDIITLQCSSLVKTQGSLSFEEIGEVVELYENQIFEDGLYKNGPTIVELPLNQLQAEKQEVVFYLPVNSQVQDGDRYTWVDHLSFKEVLRERVPFFNDVSVVLDRLNQYMKENELKHSNKLLFAFINVYGEYWVDILIPVDGGLDV